MAGLPHIVVNDFLGVQANFEGLSTQLNTLTAGQSSLVSDVASLKATVSALNQSASAVALQISSLNQKFSSVTGFRSFNVTTVAGGTTGNPLSASDSVVEVYGSAVSTVYLPAASGVTGKIYEIRNNKLTNLNVKLGSALIVKSLGRGSTARVISTGTLWRHISTTPGGNYTNSTTS